MNYRVPPVGHRSALAMVWKRGMPPAMDRTTLAQRGER